MKFSFSALPLLLPAWILQAGFLFHPSPLPPFVDGVASTLDTVVEFVGKDVNYSVEIYFDHKAVAVLRAIRRSGDNGITWGKLQKRFGENADVFFLENLSAELYILTKNEQGKWIDYTNEPQKVVSPLFRSYITPRGNALLESRDFNFWKWVIPTLISTSALIVSVFAAIS